MKFAFGLFAVTLTLVSTAFSSEIFVREARGHLNRKQVADVTSLVKNAVRNMSEYTLVSNPSQAQFTLQPSVVQRGNSMVLRVEKIRHGELMSMSEEKINGMNPSRDRAMQVTETALQSNMYGRTSEIDDSRTTRSATSQSYDDSMAQSRPIEVQSSRPSARPLTRGAGADASVGELTSASPRMISPDRAGQVQLGVGPSFAINMQNDNVMYDLLADYALDFSDNLVGKVFGDFNLATGSSNARFINLGLGADYFPTRDLLTFGKAYIGADLGFAFARDAMSRTADNVAAGLGAGFKFQAAEMNWDVNAHYTLLLAQIADEHTPSVFGVRVAMGF